MPAKLRSNLSYANVVSTLCLFILLGGSSYAAVKLRKGSVKGTNIASNAVSSPKVKNGSLLAQDFRAGQLPGGAQGPAGKPGADGATGATGAPGSAVAYASVGGGGFLLDGEQKNISRFAKTSGSGGYCLQVSVPFNNVVATIQGENPGPGEILVAHYPNGIHCTGGSDPGYNVFVGTFDNSGTASDRGFFLIAN